ncbi:gamma-glutamyl hydrolase-like [Stegostoma tigrinum]|uniref:gamma-glutamyl hydrolase-like n=1 Tax=Stegostoma tigrinum TaxID=3053191 RepID=UPI002870B17C|nr:gamma-glutamyl hydrolase-like [Stegostoma tigrinum]
MVRTAHAPVPGPGVGGACFHGDCQAVKMAVARLLQLPVMLLCVSVFWLHGVSVPLNQRPIIAGLHSRMFKNFPKNLLQALQIQPLTGHYHNWSISVKNFTNNKKLNNFYKILTTNMDNQSVEFVSTLEAIKYPIYAVQWHPERSPYEWNTTSNIPHFSEAVKVAWYLADFFVNEARRNFNHFSNTTEEEKALIYNYPPVYTGNISKFEQIYVID